MLEKSLKKPHPMYVVVQDIKIFMKYDQDTFHPYHEMEH